MIRNIYTLFPKKARITISLILILFFIEAMARIVDYYMDVRDIKSDHEHEEIKILCFGDYFTFGTGADYERTYPGQLEKILNRDSGTSKYKVINMGVIEFNSTQTYNYIKQKAEEESPDLVLVLTGRNNILNLTDSSYFILKRKNAALVNASLKIKACVFKALRNIKSYIYLKDTLSGFMLRIGQTGNYKLEWCYAFQGQDKYAKKEFQRLYRFYKMKEKEGLAGEQLRKIRELDHLESAQRYKMEGRYARAAEELAQVVYLNPANFWAYDELGMIHKIEKQYEKASADFHKSIRINIEHSRSHIELGLIDEDLYKQYKRGVRDRFESAYNNVRNQVMTGKDKDPRDLCELGWFLLIQGKNDLAKSAFEQANLLEPGNLFAAMGLSKAQWPGEEKNTEEAKLKRTLDLEPSNLLPLFSLPYASDIAKKTFDPGNILEVSGKKKYNYQMLLGAGYFYMHSNEITLAEKAFKKVIETNPENYLAHRGLLDIYKVSGPEKDYKIESDIIRKYSISLRYDLDKIIQFLGHKNIPVLLLTYPDDSSYMNELNPIIISAAEDLSTPVLVSEDSGTGLKERSRAYSNLAMEIYDILRTKRQFEHLFSFRK